MNFDRGPWLTQELRHEPMLDFTLDKIANVFIATYWDGVVVEATEQELFSTRTPVKEYLWAKRESSPSPM